MSENLPEVSRVQAVDHVAPRSFFAMEPKQQIAYASEIATVLADVIDKQKLYSNISGKNYVKVEGWQTLGTFLGIVPRERSVTRHGDGSYEAFVELIKFSDGTIVGGGSALCSIAEKRWGNSDEYARRSMAITRATGKAFRSAFSWIITLAGYEATPEEEIPAPSSAQKVEKDEIVSKMRDAITTSKSLVEKSRDAPEVYTGTTAQQKKIADHLAEKKIDSVYGPIIDGLLMNKPYTTLNVGKAIREALQQQ